MIDFDDGKCDESTRAVAKMKFPSDRATNPHLLRVAMIATCNFRRFRSRNVERARNSAKARKRQRKIREGRETMGGGS